MRKILVGIVLALIAFALLAPAPSLALSQRRLLVLKDRTSGNWSGYNQGTLEKGGKRFTQVSANWVVPTATHHSGSGDDFSSTWVGIGGGCVDLNCDIIDGTLIQTGTEQDVDSKGRTSYFGWFELIPAPSITISSSTLPVSPGNTMYGEVEQTLPGVWQITLRNVTQNKSFSTTVPYSSTMATAEWILETPLVIGGGNTGVASMPDLTTTHFNNAIVNNEVNNLGVGTVQLVAGEKITLIQDGQTIAFASSPDTSQDGFNICTYPGSPPSCPVPAD